jgi:hypothetical protein
MSIKQTIYVGYIVVSYDKNSGTFLCLGENGSWHGYHGESKSFGPNAKLYHRRSAAQGVITLKRRQYEKFAKEYPGRWGAPSKDFERKDYEFYLNARIEEASVEFIRTEWG